MEKLNEVKQALKYLEIDAKAYVDNFSASMIVSTKNILAIAEAFRDLEQRAEAAEAELERQEPAAFTSEHYWSELNTFGAVKSVLLKNGNDPDFQVELFTRPAPAADLAELVPDAKAIRKEAGGYAPVYSLQEQQLFIDGATWLSAAILRNIEEAK